MDMSSSIDETTTTIIENRALHLPYGPPDLTETPWEISSLSDCQEKVISILPIISGLLSIMGSLTIIYMACQRGRRNHRTTRKRWTPYTRLLFGMSCSDIVMSTTSIFTPYLLPAASSQRVWAFGNDTTCSVLGFFQQLSLSAMLYNGFLSYYFVLTARFGWKNDEFARTIEPVMHLIAIGFPLATATAGSIMGIYHETEIGMTCYISHYPENCEEDEDVYCQSTTLAWMFGGTILLFAFLSIPVNNLIIFLFVRKQTVRSKKTAVTTATHQKRKWRRKTLTTHDPPEDLSSVKSKSGSFSVSSRVAMPRHSSVDIEMEPDSIETASDNDDDDERSGGDTTLAQVEKQQWDDSSRRGQDEQLRRLKLVASQAFLYVGAFFICTSWSFVVKVMESNDFNAEDEDTLFPLLVFQAWFLPLQGFFNVFIYVRPKFLKHRRDYPDESCWWILRRCVQGEDVLLPSKRSQHPAVLDCKTNNPNNNIDAPPRLPVHAITSTNQEDFQIPLNDNNTNNNDVETAPLPLSSRPLPRYNNVSSITCEDLDDSSSSSSEEEGEPIRVPVNTEWRWTSGINARRTRGSSGTAPGTSSLETISELSAISFVDAEEEPTEAELDHEHSDSSTGNDTLPYDDDEDDDLLLPDVVSVRSAPAAVSDRFARFRGGGNGLLVPNRRWSTGQTTTDQIAMDLPATNTGNGNQALVMFLQHMFANFASSSDSEGSSEDGSLDPSFDRMESIKTPPSRDCPVQRPTRRLSPVNIITHVPEHVNAAPPSRRQQQRGHQNPHGSETNMIPVSAN